MGDPFRKAISGEPLRIPAQTWNAMLEVAQAHRDRQEHLGREARPRGTGGIVLVKNATGADVGRFSVLGVEGVVITPTDNEAEFLGRTALTGVAPTTDHRGRFVVLLEPLRAARLGRAVVTGPTPVQIDVTDEDHGWADVKDGDATQLASAHTGSARILWKESGTGTKWAVVLLGAPRCEEGFWARVTGHAGAGENRWSYDFEGVVKSIGGYGGWTADPSLPSGTGSAYNTVEDMNSGSGTQGNGVDLANLDTPEYTFQVQPCPAGVVVWMRPVRFGSPETVEYWFTYENGVDGGCD